MPQQRRQVARIRAALDRQKIAPVMIGDPVQTRMLADYLMFEWDIYVQLINNLTVPKGA